MLWLLQLGGHRERTRNLYWSQSLPAYSCPGRVDESRVGLGKQDRAGAETRTVWGDNAHRVGEQSQGSKGSMKGV